VSKHLPKAAKTDFEPEYGEPMETLDEFCEEHTIMKYAAIGIRWLQMEVYETQPKKNMASASAVLRHLRETARCRGQNVP
jgi:hypothetical protein